MTSIPRNTNWGTAAETIEQLVEGALDDAKEYTDTAIENIGGGGGDVGSVHLEAALVTSASVTLGAFWTVPLNSAPVNIGGGSLDGGTGIYTLPEDGLYLCVGSFRVQDSADVSTCGIGIGPVSADGPHFLWSEFPTVATRKGIRYTRVARLAAGTQLRLYVFVEGTGTVTANTQGTSLTVTKLRGAWAA